MSTYLGIDLGTSATKGVIITDSGEVLARARATHPESRRGLAGRADTRAWAQSLQHVIQKLGPAVAHVSGVGLDTHCPTVVPLGTDGGAVGLGVTWDSPAMRKYFEEYSGKRSAREVAATGNHASPATLTAVAYHLLRELEPDTFRAMDTMGLAGTWLGQVLTGVCALDPTQASYTGVFDTCGPGSHWLVDTCQELGIDPAVLPPVLDPISILGTVTSAASARFGIPEGLPVAVGSADTPAASYVLGTAPGAKPFLILGTTHVVNSCLSGPDGRSLALQRRGLRDGEWLINGVTNGGDALGAAAVFFGFGGAEDAVRDVVDLAARISPAEAADAPYFIPHIMAERGPFWFNEPVCQLHGLNRETSRAQIAYGLVEGVVSADRLVMEAVVPAGDESIYLTGAFGVDPVFPQLLADGTGRRFDLVMETDLPSLGAAGICAEATAGVRLPTPTSTQTGPRADRADLVAVRWEAWLSCWERTTGRERIPPIEAA
ncbi:xylulokinase [Raineyella fluvialis]|uniref:Xylulose kinase n=1 Tax=Raineyella fluvialis TaxID=2662261 RepID=A0A5Q2F995_9ACTN|nr:FGGY-family carbohydrate kinase [Raineyella fluvialis]QGF23258.1 xylulose kinase [Raineyella fluvialis]